MLFTISITVILTIFRSILVTWASGHFLSIKPYVIDVPHVDAGVERWRFETNTFHLSRRELTITLLDTVVLTGLPVIGRPVVRPRSIDYHRLSLRLFGESFPTHQNQ